MNCLKCRSGIATHGGRCSTCHESWCVRGHWPSSRRALHKRITYEHAHRRVKLLFGPAKMHLCVECGGEAAQWAYDGSDPTEMHSSEYWRNGNGISIAAYSRYPEFYMPMCRSCHTTMDKVKARHR